MADQMVFDRILADAEAQHRLALDHHRQLVQNWYDALPENRKHELAELLATYEWDTHAALAAAAGDFAASHTLNGN
jgi:hypothetical protein